MIGNYLLVMVHIVYLKVSDVMVDNLTVHFRDHYPISRFNNQNHLVLNFIL